MSIRTSTRIIMILLCLTCPVFLTGCWDIKDPQDINYFIAIAFDYQDDHFVVYAQMLDFASVTTPESDKPTEELPVWVGKGIGDTAASAFNDLNESSQRRVFFGHTSAVVFSERIMRHGLDNIFDLLSRYHELRYTPWVFGTKDDLEELLSATPFFHLSPIASILHQPQEMYKQKSVISPTMLREFISDIREPGKTALLPSLIVTDSNWKASMKPKMLLDLNGVYTFYSSKLEGFFPVEEIMGLRWMTLSTQRSPLVIRHEGKVYSEISIRDPKVKITPLIQDGKVKYRLEVRLEGSVIEVVEPITESRMEELASAHVKEEITSTFEHTQAQGIDIFQLEHELYLKHNGWWKEHSEHQQLMPDKDSLEVDVKVDVMTAGKMKLMTE